MNTMVKFSLCTLSDEELVKKVDKLTDEMFQRQEVPLRSIPAEPNNDYDLLIGELLIRFSNQVQAVVKVNFAEEDLEIIKELLVGNKDELKKHIFYKRNEEYCKNRLIKIEEIISKISA